MRRARANDRERTGAAGALAALAFGFGGVLAMACGQVLGLDQITYEVGDGSSATPIDAAAPDTDGSTTDQSSPPDDDGDDGGPRIPVTIATGPGPVKGVALDDTRIYWVTGGADGSVLSVLKDGGGMTTIAQGQPSPVDIAVQGTSVYWSVAPAVGGPAHCLAMVASTPDSTDAGDAAPSCAVSSPQVTVRMALGGPGLVLLAQGTGPDANKEYLGVAAPGGPLTKIETQGPSSAVTGTHQLALLGNDNGPQVDEIDLTALTFGSAACSTNCGSQAIVDMTTDVAASHVLWITSGGNVRSAPIAANGATGTSLADLTSAPVAIPQRMARDASYVYVTATHKWVFAVPIAPGDAGAYLTLSSSESGPFGIAADQAAVYWGDATGRIRMTSVP